ncbi:MAG: alpha-keto acid decarboxylase family protein [Alphaproteobacteria bacterium]|nr:alpha-keto acid decarboxylase family protein [Alphaproteobacteria bacterium]
MSDDPLRPNRRELLEAGAATALVAGIALSSTAYAADTVTVAAYLVQRLGQLGVDRLFGVPGATCDPLFGAFAEAGVPIVVTSSDLEAGYAADGYARFKGLAAVSVTYGVGTLGLASVVAGAHAERSPMVLLNGGPTALDVKLQRDADTLFSHSCAQPGADRAMFAEITAAAVRVEKAADAPATIDAALRTALVEQRPVYIEVPKDLWLARCAAPSGAIDASRPASGKEAALAQQVLQRLKAAKRPALLLGIELKRLGLQDRAEALVRALGVPYATTYLAKAVIPEQTPGFVGVYAGSRTVPSVAELIDGADLVVALGCVMGRQYRGLVADLPATVIRAEDGHLRIGADAKQPCALGPLVDALAKAGWTGDSARLSATAPKGLGFDDRRATLPPVPTGPLAASEEGLTYDEVCREVSAMLDARFLVVTDTSLSMYAAAELDVEGRDGFLCNAVWQSIGYSAGAAVGVAMAQSRRPVVLCGDGGFQMTAQALSTLARHRVPAIVLVLDNALYGIEQWLLDKRWFAQKSASPPIPHLELHRWDYAMLARSMGVQHASTVKTVAELRKALADAASADGPVVLSTRIRPHDLPEKVRG